jgi:hypothetical protein
MSNSKKFFYLISETKLDKNAIVKVFSSGKTESFSEMTEEQQLDAIAHLQQCCSKMSEQRRRIFSRVRQIKLIHKDDKLSEADVLRYIKNIKGLELREVSRLNDYTKVELWQINRKLDAIKPKQQVKYRKSLKIAK